MLFIYLIDTFNLKLKIIFMIVLPILVACTVVNSDYLKNRYFGQVFSKMYEERSFKHLEDNIYKNFINQALMFLKIIY